MTQLTKARIPARINTKKTIHLNTTLTPCENNANPATNLNPNDARLGGPA